MTPLPTTPSQVLAQVRAILAKAPEARTIGIQCVGPWQGGTSLTLGERTLQVRHCTSPLAFREQLITAENTQETTILLTPLDGHILGADVLARLHGCQLIAIQGWRIVRDLLGVDEIDPRLNKQTWMADALLQAWAMGELPPLTGRVLTLDFAWQFLLKTHLGFAEPRMDAIELARWAKEADQVNTYLQAPAEFRTHLPDWLLQSTGEVGRAMLSTLESDHGQDLIPLGLVCQVLFEDEQDRDPRLTMAITRLEERFLAGNALSSQMGREWAAAVAAVVEAELAKRSHTIMQPFQRRAEEILKEIKAEDFIMASPLLPKGLERRLDLLAQHLSASLDAGAKPKPLEALEQSARFVLSHRMIGLHPHRAEGVRMAVRLVRWLHGADQEETGPFHDAVVHYFKDSGFVDWARAHIWDGDGNPGLARAYEQLARQVDAQREEENGRFGRLIQDWSLQAIPSNMTLLIEQLLNQVVVPLARERPVLLLVLDGMSVAVFRELLQDLHMQGWVELAQGEEGLRKPVIAALPTRTEVSRASLLCGQLTLADSNREKECFRKHDGLRSTGRSNFPPVLYHKGELTASGGRGLAPEVRAEVTGIDRRVIGVVINTVDDHLAKGEQFRETWATTSIAPLGQLLDAARDANRIVILTSDHGHVVERDLAYRAHEGGQERSRPAQGPPATDEIILHGPRVWPAGEKVIVPWSEKVRYAAKKYGYHGGVSPQEVVVPLAIFHSGSREPPAGWREVVCAWPTWWERQEEMARPVASKGVTRKHTASLPSPEPSRQVGDWITALLQSPVYQEQKRLCARTALEEDKVRRFLELLDGRGGKITRLALATTLEIPRMRFPGILAGLRRLLNVDGYAVLEVDDNTDRVELNKKLLFTQFEIEDIP